VYGHIQDLQDPRQQMDAADGRAWRHLYDRIYPACDELQFAKAEAKAPRRSLVSIDDVGVAVAFLCMNGAKLITGETLYVDGGYHIID